MALEVKVNASLSQASLAKLKEQIKSAGKGVKLELGVNKTVLKSAVSDALKGIKNAKLTISKIAFSADAKKQMKEIERYYREREAAQKKSSAIDSEIFDLKKSTGAEKVASQWEQNREALKAYSAEFKELQDAYNSAETPKQLQLANEQFKNLKVETDALIKSEKERQRVSESVLMSTVERAQKEARAAEETSKAEKKAEQERAMAAVRLQTLQNKIADYFNKNTIAAEKYKEEIRLLNAAIEEAMASGDSKKVAELSARFNELRTRIAAAGDAGSSFGDKMRKAFDVLKSYVSVYQIFTMLTRAARDAYQNVKEIDTAMVELRKVTDESERSYSEFLTRAGSSAREVGRTISGIVDATATWAKLGYTMEEAEALAKTSSVFANVADLSDEEAVADLVTAMKAFNIEASDSLTIADKLNELGNRFATDAAALGSGLARSASAMQVAGNDINQTLALITGGTEITQDADSLSNSLKVISMRLRGRHICPIMQKYMTVCA